MKPHIALLCMVKNEEKRIHVTLNSIIGTCSYIVIYDTGSTDNTINIIKDFSKNNNIPLRLIEKQPILLGKYFDYASNRNVLLNYADQFDDIDFYLLMDCNDELRGDDELLKFAEKEVDSGNTAYYTCQLCYSGSSYNRFFNVRFIKPKKGWHYKMPVHEYIHSEPHLKRFLKMTDKIVIYQDGSSKIITL